jgi:hypothetical protein
MKAGSYEHSCEFSGCEVESSARRIVLYGAINEHRESTAVYESMCVNVRITFCSVWYRGV